MDSGINETNLRIFTLNCWGLRYVSDHRQQRIKLIGQHLVEHNYDIVFLQEIWVQSDFETIRKSTQSKFKFAHMFKNASILGTSEMFNEQYGPYARQNTEPFCPIGLVVLAKWSPKLIHFQPFSVNGSPFRPNHGDWFTSKGVGYVRIELNSLNLHLFCTHMHAQYNMKERLNDQYSVHRICQSYEMSKFVELMTNCGSNNSNAIDLAILAGDLNASSKELPFRMLVGLTELKDCFKFRTNSNKQKSSNGGGDSLTKELHISNDILDSDLTDDEFHTCEHRDNTFTPKQNIKNNSGKRIDFILFRLFDKMNNRNNEVIECIEDHICGVEHLTIQCKDESGLSFSDHQPVVAQFRIRCFDTKTFRNKNAGDDHLLDNDLAKEDPKSDSRSGCVSTGNKIGNGIKVMSNGDGSYDKNLHENTESGVRTQSNNNKTQIISNDRSDKTEKTGLILRKPKLRSNVLLGVEETTSKLAKSSPLQLKQIASNAIKSKLDSIPSNKQELLEKTKCLLEDYVSENQWNFIYFLCVSLCFLICLFVCIPFICINFTFNEVFLIISLITLVTFVCLFLKFLSFRNELNAIKAILNNIEKEVVFN